jgi:hypothetical protein
VRLQALLDSQQVQLREQQSLWDEQRRALKQSVMELVDRVNASQV